MALVCPTSIERQSYASVLLANKEAPDCAPDLCPEADQPVGGQSLDELDPDCPAAANDWIPVGPSEFLVTVNGKEFPLRGPKVFRTAEWLCDRLWRNVPKLLGPNGPGFLKN